MAAGPKLELIYGNDVRSLSPAQFFIVGRSNGADLRIDLPIVSRRHLVIGYKNGWYVEDLGSHNGVFVRGEKVERVALTEATEVRLGNAKNGPVLQLQPDAASVSAAATRSLTPQEFSQMLRTVAAPPLLTGALEALTVRAHHAPAASYAGAPPQPGAAPVAGLAAPAGAARMAGPATLTGGLEVRGLEFTVEGGKKLLRDITFDAGRGTLTAIVGPSGAGKSTFARAVSGLTKPSGGQVSFDGVDVHAQYDRAKSMIGMVPQEDVIHGQLKLLPALRYAAKLRLGSDVTPAEREAHVQRALAQLDLEAHIHTRISKLSGGQRKRASVALELLTEPAFLILDEPTSGLDPALDRQLMSEFRALANGGRTVLTITHSVACLDVCDQVLVLVPGGAPAFIGSEQSAFAYFNTIDWSNIFDLLKNDPQGCADRWLASVEARALAVEHSLKPAQPVPDTEAPQRATSRPMQFFTLVQRQLSLMLADRGYTAFLIALPFVIGLLPLVVPGETGLTRVQGAKNAQEPQMILTLLTIGAVFMGISMSIRDLVGERSIYERERAVGLSTSAYLAAKIFVYVLLGIAGSIIIVTISSLLKDPPTGDGVLGLGARTELTIGIAVTISVGVLIGLLLSALVSSQNQVMPVLIVVLMVQMVLNGGLIPLIDSGLLNSISMTVPARWSMSMGAVSIDMHHLLSIADEVERAAAANSMPELDPMWNPNALRWWLAAGVLSAMSALMVAVTWWRTRTR
ncbi:ABC-type multidrug transport system ATPase subunit [Leucobacter exalbidus]|uniref:ABC-type multidrug transport system ATPase subunit n=1 Tax=Leucobacter exalbidus TaxID=662960 RepID=A0A940PPT2_9MICO|nr:ATP-binding cassette domain-containing protein [Leucobacter exalbidus]MBP1327098.1 ABC-type multidrug transport system ATPase subunit [Leucobacter exalbidus]